MTVLNTFLIKVFRGPLDLNGPILGRAFFLFEYVRTYMEERSESFDARFGTDTAAPTFEPCQKRSSHFYVPTTASLIYDIFRRLPLEPDEFEFVDMGSGKGRAVLIASEFPFKKIIGIELSEQLNDIAASNVERYTPCPQPCRNIELRRMNALEYDFGEEPLILFLFDPFGRKILEQVIANLESSLQAKPRKAYVVYVYPQFADVMERSTVLHRTAVGGPSWQPWSKYAVYATSNSVPIEGH